MCVFAKPYGKRPHGLEEVTGVSEFQVGLIALVIIPSITGGFVSDYIKTLKGEYYRVNVIRILIGAVFSIVITYSALYGIWIDTRPNYLLLASFLLSLVGFEIAQYVCTLDGYVTLVTKADKIIKPILGWWKDFNEFRRLKSEDKKDESDSKAS